jgi:hypothetical protein
MIKALLAIVVGSLSLTSCVVAHPHGPAYAYEYPHRTVITTVPPAPVYYSAPVPVYVPPVQYGYPSYYGYNRFYNNCGPAVGFSYGNRRNNFSVFIR